jgi:hypothetical protein
MRIIQSVAPDLSVGLTDDNKLVIMVETSNRQGEVTDIDHLVHALRSLELIQMEISTQTPKGTPAEVELLLQAKAEAEEAQQ